MCRWLAYAGSTLLLEALLYKPKHSLIDQSMSSKSAETPTNADGFGVGWYAGRPAPGLFRSIRPAWNDFNLRDLAAQIEAHVVLAHVRATSMATVQETNCHPFRFGEWLFVHNGELFGIERYRKRILAEVADEYFPNMLGTTDSEALFHLALTYGLRDDPIGALARAVGFIEDAARAKGIDEAVWMTVCVTDGHRLHAVRYASDGKAPTLFHSRDMADVVRVLPELDGRLSDESRFIVSEPIGRSREVWVEVPQASSITVEGASIEVRPFRPIAPAAVLQGAAT
jgi:glutamine amidotransferase